MVYLVNNGGHTTVTMDEVTKVVWPPLIVQQLSMLQKQGEEQLYCYGLLV
jgi:hypothetical protein